ncbi:MAG: POTRA domain-containing protein [Flavisolibacter sp.]
MPAKLKHLVATISFLTTFLAGGAQSYRVHYQTPEGDTSFAEKLSLQKLFTSQTDAGLYIVQLPSLLLHKGYITASVDSMRLDSSSAFIVLYLGEQYKWARIATRPQDEWILQPIHWPDNMTGAVDFSSLQTWQRKILDYLEENGRPFGKVYLDSISINGGEVNALLKIETGPVYKIDSIRVYGDAKVSNEFLQRYLDIPNGSVYNKNKLDKVSKRLSQLSYLQQEHTPTIDYLGTGSVLNLYLKARKNSQANALIGFLPSTDAAGNQKLRLTVDANVLLRNALNNGETIGLIWQQLQQQSPRLNILYDQPFAFHSNFGVNFLFDMYKKDSAYLNINMNLGTSYQLEERKTARVFLQRRQTIVSTVNEQQIIQNRQLPQEADVSSTNLGVGYEFNNTDYRLSPAKGNEFVFSTTAGTKQIKKNQQILDLKDPNEPDYNFDHLYDTVKLKAYQFRVITSAAHYIPLGKQNTIKLALNAGIYQSANYFRNELFQIGGYKLMRGFDEESQYVSQYAVGTVEYRYRIALNSFFFVFTDGGLGKHILEEKQNHSYLGTGVGLSLETKAGIINLAGALGKRDDTQFNFREFKIHIGFASYF